MMIIVDFDGTVVDIWKRYYRVFCEAMGVSSVDILDYKMAKLRFRRDENVAKELGLTMPHDYFRKKRHFLEERCFLKEDTLLIAREDLLVWFQNTNSILLTKRRSRSNLLFELDLLGLKGLKDQVTVLNPDAGISKKEWVANNLFLSKSTHGYVIGDSEEDMLVGENPRIQPLFVKSGLQAYRKVCAGEEEFERIGEAFKYIESRKNYVL